MLFMTGDLYQTQYGEVNIPILCGISGLSKTTTYIILCKKEEDRARKPFWHSISH